MSARAMTHPINECLTLFTNTDVATSTLRLHQFSHMIPSQPSQSVKSTVYKSKKYVKKVKQSKTKQKPHKNKD